MPARTPSLGPRQAAWLLWASALALHMAAGWTHALPVVDAWIWLLQVSDDPAVPANLAPGLAHLGLDRRDFIDQIGAFHAATGRAFAVYAGWGQSVARFAGLDAVRWKIANIAVVLVTLQLLGATARGVGCRPWVWLAIAALLLVPLADRAGFDTLNYLTSAEVPGMCLIALGARSALVPRTLGGLVMAVAVFGACLCKESLVAFAPAVALLRWRTVGSAWRAAWPIALAALAVGGWQWWIRSRYPLAHTAYTALAGGTERAPLGQALLRAGLTMASQVWLPIPSTTLPAGFKLGLILRAMWLASLGWLLWSLGMRVSPRLLWANHRQAFVLAAAWLGGALATLLVYWLLGRDVYNDFHTAPAAFGLAMAAATASTAVVWLPAPGGRPLAALGAVAVMTLAVAAATAEWAVLAALAVALAGAWVVARRRHNPTAVWAVALALVLAPRMALLAADRQWGVQEPESLQRAVAQMQALPSGAVVHIDLGQRGNVEYAYALRAYAILHGRTDLRTCVSADAGEPTGAVSAYTAQQFQLASADAAQLVSPAAALDVVIGRYTAAAATGMALFRPYWKTIQAPRVVLAAQTRSATPCPALAEDPDRPQPPPARPPWPR